MSAKIILALLVGLLLLIGCNKQQTIHNEETVADAVPADTLHEEDLTSDVCGFIEVAQPPKSMDELFDDFIFNFSSNAHIQRKRISFPLPLNVYGDEVFLERDEWEYQDLFGNKDYYTVFFNDAKDEYLESSNECETVDFEHINIIDEVVRTFHFDRKDGRWMLTHERFINIDSHPLADFFRFYHRFTTDSIFCQHSLNHNIKYTTTDPDDDFAQMEGTLTSEQWESFAPELPQGEFTNIDYGQSLINTNHIVMQKRGLGNGMFDELTFTRNENGWHLTRYEN